MHSHAAANESCWLLAENTLSSLHACLLMWATACLQGSAHSKASSLREESRNRCQSSYCVATEAAYLAQSAKLHVGKVPLRAERVATSLAGPHVCLHLCLHKSSAGPHSLLSDWRCLQLSMCHTARRLVKLQLHGRQHMLACNFICCIVQECVPECQRHCKSHHLHAAGWRMAAKRTAPETRHCSRSAGQPWHRPESRRARSSRQSTPGSAPGQVTLQMHQHGSVTIWQALNILDVQNTQPRGSPAMAVDIIASTSSP